MLALSCFACFRYTVIELLFYCSDSNSPFIFFCQPQRVRLTAGHVVSALYYIAYCLLIRLLYALRAIKRISQSKTSKCTALRGRGEHIPPLVYDHSPPQCRHKTSSTKKISSFIATLEQP